MTSKYERAAPASLPSSLPGLPPVVIRPLRRDVERESNYVRSSWTQSALSSRPGRVWLDAEGAPKRYEPMDQRVFFEAHMRRLVPRLFARSTILVAEPTNTPGMLAGWIAFEPARRAIEPGFARPEVERPAVVHYLYVTHELRKHGVASLLATKVPAGPVAYAHWAPRIERLAARLGWVFDETRKWD